MAPCPTTLYRPQTPRLAWQGTHAPTPEILPLSITAPLSGLQVAMLQAAAAGTLRRSGWRVTIAGQHASVVTLTKLQDRGLVRHVSITEAGRTALGLAKGR